MIFAKYGGYYYEQMSMYDIRNRIKNLKKCYPEFRQKELELIDKREDSSGEDFFSFLGDFEELAIEYSLKCPDIIVHKVESQVKAVSKQFFNEYFL